MDNPFNISSSIILCSVIVLCCAILFYAQVISPYKQYPSIPARLLVQILFAEFQENASRTSIYFQKLLENCQKFQSEGFCVLWLPTPHLFIFNEEAVKLVLNEETAVNKSHDCKVFKPVMGEGLITSNGDQWRRNRKRLNPVFKLSALKEKVPILNKHAAILAEKLKKVPHESVDIYEYLKICAFSNICESMLGLDVTERKEEAERITSLVDEIFDKFIEGIMNPWLHYKYKLGLFSSGRKYLLQIKELRELTRKILLEVKESVESSQENNHLNETEEFCRLPGTSFAHILVEHHLKDPAVFTMKYMLDELTTFVSAGYHTVSHALMWCLFLLGHDQEVQDQVYNELKSVSQGDLSISDLANLPYLECVIKETLRLYPTVPLHLRELGKNLQCGKYKISKGTNVVLFPYFYHRNPNIFQDPEKFDPSRFFRENFKPWTLTYFAEGKRSCIGRKFALMELKIVLAHLIRTFKFTSLEQREDVKISWNITLSTEGPVHLNIALRP